MFHDPPLSEITNEGVKGYYRDHPWERYWLEHLAPDFLPVQFYSRRRCETVMSLIGRSRTEPFTAIDLGCGIGLYAINLCRRFENAHVVAVDISREQLLTARELALETGTADRITFLCADVERLDLRRTFDIVLCSELLEHFPDPHPVLDRLKSLSTDRTQILFSVPHRYSGTDHSGIIFRQIMDDGSLRECLSADQLLPDRPVLWFYHGLFDEKALDALLRSAGILPGRWRFSGFMPAWKDQRSLEAVEFLQQAVKASAALSPRLPGVLDGMVNRAFGNRYAANIVVDARVALPPAGGA